MLLIDSALLILKLCNIYRRERKPSYSEVVLIGDYIFHIRVAILRKCFGQFHKKLHKDKKIIMVHRWVERKGVRINNNVSSKKYEIKYDNSIRIYTEIRIIYVCY